MTCQTERAMTVIQVADLDRSMAFYAQLGFAINGVWGDPPGVAIVQRGLVTLMVQLADRVPDISGRWSAYIYVTDPDALYQSFVDAGLTPDGPPDDRYYGCRDFNMTDPDGHCFAFGKDLTAYSPGPGLGQDLGDG